MKAALALLLALTAALAMATLGAAAPAGAAETCANEARRTEQGTGWLPECRAYELVSGETLVGQDSRAARAADDGGAITYYSIHPGPEATSNSYFHLASRGPAGWTIQSVGPQNEAAALFEGACEQSVFFSPDLTRNIVEISAWFPSEPAHCKRPAQLVAGEPPLTRNVLLHDMADDSYQLVNLTPETAAPENSKFIDASDDFSRIVFAERAQLTPEAPADYDYYLWHEGTVRLLTFLPDGTPVAGELVDSPAHQNSKGFVSGDGFAPLTGALSSDGREAFFSYEGKLYLRRNPEQPQSPLSGGTCTEPQLACTVEIDTSQGPGASGGGNFWRATDDGSSVFFTDANKLTADSTAVTGKPDLYRYEIATGALTDLTVDATEPANVRGVVAMSEDGSYLYFVADGALTADATPGTCPLAYPAITQCNLYVLHAGTPKLVARLSSRERWVWQEPEAGENRKTTTYYANASPDGRYLAFLSTEPLTGHSSYDPVAESYWQELFLYDAAGEGELSCASCPSGPANPGLVLATAGNYNNASEEKASWRANSVLDDGSVFFETQASLLPADTNKRADVYEFRAGQLSLISPGNFEGAAHFLDASPDGTDVFLRTPQPLIGADADSESVSLYDARAGGGFAEPAPAGPPCEGEGCRPPSEAAPALPAPGPVPPAPPGKPPCKPTKNHTCKKKHGHQHRGHKDAKHRGKDAKKRAAKQRRAKR